MGVQDKEVAPDEPTKRVQTGRRIETKIQIGFHMVGDANCIRRFRVTAKVQRKWTRELYESHTFCTQ